jgi:thiamine biosynthesis lipoprotein
MSFADLTFRCMGSDVRLVISQPHAVLDAADARTWLEDFAARLTRFDPASELCKLNADPRPVVPASPLLRAAVASGLWAAERTSGLVDPTLTRALEAAGYATSREGEASAPLAEAVAAAPPRSPARPHPDAAWRRVVVDEEAGTIARPPGLALDSGGVGKGLAADALAHRLARHARFAVDCGGDVRVGGADPAAPPIDIEVAHPLTGAVAHRLALRAGAIATSGLDVRVWRREDGGFAHHLLDPSTGEPAWTGLVGATAMAPSALEAETLAKAALLSGPEAGARVLGEHGGLLFAEDGAVQRIAGAWEREAA